MTLGTLQAHAHEHLGDIFGQLQGIALDLVEVGRRVIEGTAGGTEQFDDDFVEWLVGGDALLQPVVVE